MSGFETIEIIVRDGMFKKLESWKWNILNWSKIEQTWSYLRRKYGKSKAEAENDSSWIKE